MIHYLIALAATQSLLVLWFYGPLRSSLGRMFIDKNIITNDDFNIALQVISPFLAKLFSCYICCSFWFSLAVGLGLCIGLNLTPWFPVLTFSTFPSFTFLYKLLVDKLK